MSYHIGTLWLPMNVLLLCVNVIAQPGFLSIDCGGKRNRTAPNKIRWVTDANYIDVGEIADVGNVSQQACGSYLHDNLRFFPKPLSKSCYHLPVASNERYLLRTWFAIGNSGGFKQSPNFTLSIETLDMLAFSNITAPYDHPQYSERIFVSSGRVVYVCLIRTSESDDPFINAIELRTLQHGMYRQASLRTSLLMDSRVDLGGKSTVRYPEDNFDRIWTPNFHFVHNDIADVRNVSSEEPISTKDTENMPPSAVMQTAFVVNSSVFQFLIGSPKGKKSLLLIYLAEIEKLNMSERRSFRVMINGDRSSEFMTLVPKNSSLELPFVSTEADKIILDLQQASYSTSSPIINAYEFYILVDTQPATYSQDIKPLDAIKSRFGIRDWISDPCYLIHWEGIHCDTDNISSTMRISELNLSGRNFTGTVPADIGQLTALVNVSLANNHLIGALPNFSKLNMLERLHLEHNNLSGNVPDWLSQLKKLKELSLDNNILDGILPDLSNLIALEKLHLTNNNLSGTVPEWLSRLTNLKELFIENNNFSGVIPGQLLNNTSLHVRYSGNQYLCIRMHKGKCVLYNSGKDKLSVVLGISISGALMVSLALMVGVVIHLQKCRSIKRLNVGIAVYWKKFRTKQSPSEDHTMITVTSTTKCRAFTPEEIMAATQNFSRKIGQGGFGSVFFGKLPEEKEIAVKVLSLFSRQGFHEFQNEIDLLSRIHHKNLVSLLGYCNESRELMLIYDHMSGGSLRDRLYGPSAGLSALNWKTRLKIALDAAHGLEYLHMGCTPKIIHRDIKTSNILLDTYMNGKLADFGLSKMTVDDGEASHVTTMVKGTPGYLDPEYFRTQMLTEKSDIYSFGVVLLEILCGRPPINTNLPEEQLNLVQWVTPYVYVETDGNPGKSISGEIEEIRDKRMGGNYDIKSIVDFAKLGLRCVDAKPSSRPSASEVVAEIKEIIVHQKYNTAAPVSEETGIEHGDWQVGPVTLHAECSKPKDMVWRDNSCNISQVGR